MSAIDDLLVYIFDGARPPLYGAFEEWVRGSRRFQSFADEYRSKIRAKVRNAQGGERMDDLCAELETAALLLQEKRFSLEYEKYSALKQRGPDFTVTFRTHTPFNVEVRRVRDAAHDTALTGKLVEVLCEKVRQMPPSVANLLWLHADADISVDSLTEAVNAVRNLVEGKDEAFFKRRRFQSAAAFHKQYLRLSGVLLPPAGGPALWLSPMARHQVPRQVELALQRLPQTAQG